MKTHNFGLRTCFLDDHDSSLREDMVKHMRNRGMKKMQGAWTAVNQNAIRNVVHCETCLPAVGNWLCKEPQQTSIVNVRAMVRILRLSLISLPSDSLS